MADYAFDKFLGAFDTAAKREENFGRNQFADMMAAGYFNEAQMNNLVTRAYNVANTGTINLKNIGLGYNNQLAAVALPGQLDIAGAQSDAQRFGVANGTIGAAFGADINTKGANADAALAMAQQSRMIAEQNAALATQDIPNISRLFNIPATDIIMNQGVPTYQGKAIMPTPIQYGFAQRQLASDQATQTTLDYVQRMKAMQLTNTAVGLPTTPATGGASPNLVIGNRVFDPTSAPAAEPNTPGIKNAAGMTPMINPANAALLRAAEVAMQQSAPSPVAMAGAIPEGSLIQNPVEAANRGQWRVAEAAKYTNPALAVLNAEAARLIANGLNPSEVIARRDKSEAEFAAAQQATVAMDRITQQTQAQQEQQSRGYRKSVDTRALISMGLQSSPNGHVVLSAPQLMQLTDIAQRDPGLAAVFGVTPTYLETVKRYNATLPSPPVAPPRQPLAWPVNPNLYSLAPARTAK